MNEILKHIIFITFLSIVSGFFTVVFTTFMRKGMIFEFWKLFIWKKFGETSPFYKVLGGCAMCFGVWFGTILFFFPFWFFFGIHFENPFLNLLTCFYDWLAFIALSQVAIRLLMLTIFYSED